MLRYRLHVCSLAQRRRYDKDLARTHHGTRFVSSRRGNEDICRAGELPRTSTRRLRSVKAGSAMNRGIVTMQTLAEKRAQINRAAEARRVYDVRVFGSVARGDNTPASDVDFLVKPRPGCTLFDLGGGGGSARPTRMPSRRYHRRSAETAVAFSRAGGSCARMTSFGTPWRHKSRRSKKRFTRSCPTCRPRNRPIHASFRFQLNWRFFRAITPESAE